MKCLHVHVKITKVNRKSVTLYDEQAIIKLKDGKI